MTRHSLLIIHPVAMPLREATPVAPRLAGTAKTPSDAARLPRSDRPTHRGQSSSGDERSRLSDHRTVPNHQPNPQSP